MAIHCIRQTRRLCHGCWVGRLSDFEARVSKINPSGRYKDELRAVIEYIRTTAAIPQE